MSEPPTLQIPQPLEVRMDNPSPPAPSPWAEPTRHLRDIARWMTGGVIATAAAVATGTSLTNLGTLDPVVDRVRLALAIVGLAMGIAGIALILRRALAVLNIDVTSLDELVAAESQTQLGQTRAAVEQSYRFEANRLTWDEIVRPGSTTGDHIERALPYFHVRMRFDRLVAVLAWAGIMGIVGFVLFAWAANPPPRAPKPEKGVTMRIVS